MKLIQTIRNKIKARHNRNQAIHQLEQMTNRELADIGITRGDIRRRVS